MYTTQTDSLDYDSLLIPFLAETGPALNNKTRAVLVNFVVQKAIGRLFDEPFVIFSPETAMKSGIEQMKREKAAEVQAKRKVDILEKILEPDKQEEEKPKKKIPKS